MIVDENVWGNASTFKKFDQGILEGKFAYTGNKPK